MLRRQKWPVPSVKNFARMTRVKTQTLRHANNLGSPSHTLRDTRGDQNVDLIVLVKIPMLGKGFSQAMKPLSGADFLDAERR